MTKKLLFGLVVLCAWLVIDPKSALMFAPLLLFGAVTENQFMNLSQGGLRSNSPATNKRLYGGTLGFYNASGHVDDTTNAGANAFAGLVEREVDNSAGSAGDLDCELLNGMQWEGTGSGFTQADVGKKIYASDNYTITTTAASNTLIGTCRKFVSATKLIVELDAQTP